MKLKPTQTQSLGPDKISYINMKNNLLFHKDPTDKRCDAPCPSDQSSYINMNNATKTQLMRGATPPTNQIQAATSLTKKGNPYATKTQLMMELTTLIYQIFHYTNDPTEEGCDAPRQPASTG